MPFVVIGGPLLYYKCKEDGGFAAPRRAPSFTSNFTFNTNRAPASSALAAPTVELTLGVGGGGGGGGGEYKWAKSLKTLVDMGFEEAQAKQALEDTNGNEREALTKLIDS